MDKSKILFLDTDSDPFFREERNKTKNVDSMYLYKKRNIFINLLIFLGININEKILWFTYGQWKKSIDNYDIIILPSRKSAKYALSYLTKKTNKRVIVWYWNIVTKEEMNPNDCKNKGAEVWTFDPGDSKKYNMNFNDQYYFDMNDINKPKTISNDIYYIGAEKEGRTDIILDFIESLKKINIKNTNINIVRNKKIKINKNINYATEKKYDEIIHDILDSKAILDINNTGQIGLTIRPLESIFFKKKLITNNSNIKTFDFYNKNNIFIIGEDKIEDLNNFINSKYIDIPNNIISYYKFDSWITRITKKTNK